jgi:hypothetical protein
MEKATASRADRVPPIEVKMNSYIVELIIRKGDANRMLIMISDVTKSLQEELDSKDDLNLHRKAYGNLKACLEAFKHPVFYIDGSLVVKLKKYEEIMAIKDKCLSSAAWSAYDAAYKVRQP